VIKKPLIIPFLVTLIFSTLSPVTIHSANAETVGTAPCIATISSATGVTSTTSGNYCYVAFTSTGKTTWTVPSGVTSAQYLLVGGGGGGGGGRGGGGGGGGVLTGTWNSLNEYSAFNIWVGAGGSGGPSTQRGVNGGYSAIVPPDFGTAGLYLWAGGGGGGGSGNTNGSISYGGNADALAGASISQVRGSGGGAGFNFSLYGTRYWSLGGTGAYNGGNTYLCTTGDVYHDSNRSTGGGGGAGGNGGGFGSAGVSLSSQCTFSVFAELNANFYGNSNGGIGKYDSFTNEICQLTAMQSIFSCTQLSNKYFGAGGGGSDGRGANETGYNALGAGSGGNTGGGNGQITQSGSADYFSAGKANTGGGGGGGLGTGAAGGSGIVVLKYLQPISITNKLSSRGSTSTTTTLSSGSASFSASGACTVNSSSGVVTFTSTGNCTVTARDNASNLTASTTFEIVPNLTQRIISRTGIQPNSLSSFIPPPYITTDRSESTYACLDIVGASEATVLTGTNLNISLNSISGAVMTSLNSGKSFTITGTLAQVQTALSTLKINSTSGRIMAANSGSIYLRVRANLIADATTDAQCLDIGNDGRIALYQYTSDQIRRKNVPQKSGSTP